MSYNGRDFWSASVSLTSAAQQYYSPQSLISPFENNSFELTVFISCYNQEAKVIQTLDTIIEAMDIVGKSYEVIIIDDNSADGSFEHLRNYLSRNPDVNIILYGNKKNKGLAQNYLSAAFMGHGKYFCMIHGDNEEPVETMIDLFGTVGEADILIPYDISLMTEGSGFVSGMTNGLLNLVSGHRINDYSYTQIHLRYNVMRWHPGTERAGFQLMLLCILLDIGFTCKQVPCRKRVLKHKNIGAAIGNILSTLRTVIDIMLMRLFRKIGW